MVAIIDYGLGNLQSVSKAFQIIDRDVRISSSPSLIKKANIIVLPGVGAFLKGMENLKNTGILDTVIREINKGKPFLGICLGLQLLFTYSQEHTLAPGMNIIKGEVVKFTNDLKIPHMGWNQVEYTNNELTKKLFKNIPQKAYFYFVHSYYVKPKEEAIIVATTWYGEIFPSAVVKNNIVGVQFHPEKSGDMGLKFLKNFLEIYGNAY